MDGGSQRNVISNGEITVTFCHKYCVLPIDREAPMHENARVVIIKDLPTTLKSGKLAQNI